MCLEIPYDSCQKYVDILIRLTEHMWANIDILHGQYETMQAIWEK